MRADDTDCWMSRIWLKDIMGFMKILTSHTCISFLEGQRDSKKLTCDLDQGCCIDIFYLYAHSSLRCSALHTSSIYYLLPRLKACTEDKNAILITYLTSSVWHVYHFCLWVSPSHTWMLNHYIHYRVMKHDEISVMNEHLL